MPESTSFSFWSSDSLAILFISALSSPKGGRGLYFLKKALLGIKAPYPPPSPYAFKGPYETSRNRMLNVHGEPVTMTRL